MLDIGLPKSSAEEAVQRGNRWDVKLHLSECKVTPIMVQSYKHQDAIPNIFDFNSAYLSTANAPLPIKSQSSQNCIFMQSECVFMQFWVSSSDLIVKIRA